MLHKQLNAGRFTVFGETRVVTYGDNTLPPSLLDVKDHSQIVAFNQDHLCRCLYDNNLRWSFDAIGIKLRLTPQGANNHRSHHKSETVVSIIKKPVPVLPGFAGPD